MQVEIHSSFTRDSKKLSSKIKNDIADAIAMIYDAKRYQIYRALLQCRAEGTRKMLIGCALATIEFAFILEAK